MKTFVPKTPYERALWKVLHQPIRLTPADIHALKARDQWLASAAVKQYLAAMRRDDYERKYGLPTDTGVRR